MLNEESNPNAPLTRMEAEAVEERTAPPGKVVYLAILSEGESELERPTSALLFSGLAAGLSMGFSAIFQALFAYHLG